MRNDYGILFLAATHGDEGFTIHILKDLKREFSEKLHWLVANEKALDRKVRFIDADLNRSAPGNPDSAQYEMRRASELIKMAKKYRFVIDLHGTTANSGIFVLIPNPTPKNIALAASLPVRNVVIWAAKSSEKLGPLTQFVDCGVEIECGPKSSESVKDELAETIRTVLIKGLDLNSAANVKQNWFRVYGKAFKKGLSAEKNLLDFKQAKLNGETFYPLLSGQYENVLCYKMEAISFWNFFSY